MLPGNGRIRIGVRGFIKYLVAALFLSAGIILYQGVSASVPTELPMSSTAGIANPNNGVDPTYIRKLPPPADSPRPVALDPVFRPLACAAPVSNASQRSGNEAESFVVVNPNNLDNIVAFSNLSSENSIFRAYTFNGGNTWTRSTIVTGGACCDAQAAFDSFGNLFVVYINSAINQINVVLSTDGGVTFGSPVTVGSGSIDQPSIAVGNGSVWIDWNQSGSMLARGAPVTGLGAWGPFNAQQAIPSATGSFGGIAVGPGPNGGKVMVTYMNPTSGQGPATIYVNVDADGLGAGAFGSRITASTTNVGGFDFIPAQSRRSVDAEPGLVWDSTGGAYNNRAYLVYSEETINENNDTETYVRTSTNDGATWSAPLRVNDDPLGVIRSQFLPYIALDRTTGTVAVGWLDARNDNGVPGSGGTNSTPNDDAEYYATYSTDGGASWAANTRLSGGFSNANAGANNVDYGDYVGTSAHGGKYVALWADNANCDGSNANGTLTRFDLYLGTLNFQGQTTATPTFTSLPTNTPTVTPSITNTRTNTPTSTSTPSAILVGHITIQGRPAQPHPLHSVPITLTLKSFVSEIDYSATTDTNGTFTVTAPVFGLYNWRAKNVQTLANSGTVKLVAGTTHQEMGLLKEGDATNDNCVNVQDFGILKTTFGKGVGDPGYDARADFNGDNLVGAPDFNLMKGNFGVCGADPIEPSR